MTDKIDTSTAAIEALLDGVTEGPWSVGMEYCETLVAVQTDEMLIAEWGGLDSAGSCKHEIEANARFIAAARDLVPALAAERDALAAEIERLREHVADTHQKWTGEVESIRAAWLAQRAEAEAREIALDKLRRVGLGPQVADLHPAELSGGMPKRAASSPRRPRSMGESQWR